MRYRSGLLSDGRWGIFLADELLATVGSEQACREIVEALNQTQHRKQKHTKQRRKGQAPQPLQWLPDGSWHEDNDPSDASLNGDKKTPSSND